ncbi:STAS domain-containing protein [Streptomyces kanasensis]|uniref:STAS domain-containing protein n=1 Tax=Streptomyces kanasensis TaxID=936756 RepID=UPI0036FB0C90
MSRLTITTRTTATGPLLRIAGDLDYATSEELRTHVTGLRLEPGQCLVLELGGMEFCDSSGITALLVARHHATAAGADVALTAVPDHTRRILRIVGLDQIFTIRPDGAPAAS